MLIVVAFISLALICCLVAAFCGGWEGRIVALITVGTVLFDRAVGSVDLRLAASPMFRLGLDGALLLGFVLVMVRSRRWWPIWIAGLQFNGVLAHVSTMLVSSYTPAIYRGLESFWGVPIMLVMAMGSALDHRAGFR